MKRLRLFAVAILALGALLAGGAALLPWLVPGDVVRQALMTRIAATTGRLPTISGPVSLRVFPMPVLHAEGVRLEGVDAGEPLAEIAVIESDLQWLPLLIGQIDAGSLTLTKARINLSIDGDGRASWEIGAAESSGAQTLDGVGRLRLIDSSVLWANAVTARKGTLSIGDITIDWPRGETALSGWGTLVWRGETVDVNLSIGEPASLLKQGSTSLRLKAKTEKLRVSINGTASVDGGLRIAGDFGAASPSLRSALAWFGLKLPDGTSLGIAELQARAALTMTSLAFTEARLKLDGNEAEGALTVDLASERPLLSGTLAAETFDLSPYGRGLGLVAGPRQQWRKEPIDLSFLSEADLDIRLSAAEALNGAARIGRVAVTVVMRDGTLELSLGEASAYGGTVSGRLSAKSVEKSAVATASLDFDHVDLDSALGDFLGFRRIEGVGSGKVALTATGNSVETLVAGLAGEGQFSARNGALVGVDLADMLRRIQRRPLSASFEGRGGRTAFETAGLTVAVVNGTASSSDIVLKGPGIDLTMTGQMRLSDLGLDLTGHAALVPTEGAAAVFELPFTVGGMWTNPSIEADADALIRQSGAAAPLLGRALKPKAPDAQPATGAAPAAETVVKP